VAAYIGSVMNNSVSNTVITDLSKRNESYRKLDAIILIGVCMYVCMLHCSALLYRRTVQHADTNTDLIYVAIPPSY